MFSHKILPGTDSRTNAGGNHLKGCSWSAEMAQLQGTLAALHKT